MSGGVVTRFAPSPTGRLHLGHGYSAIRAHDFARQAGGRFLLRFEDIDGGRVRDEYYGAIERDLAWLGLDWDAAPMRQSDRFDAYVAALEALKMRGLVYPCFCTRKDIAAEIAASASAPHGVDGPFYPGTCRGIGDKEVERRMGSEAHAWRLDMEKAVRVAGPLTWEEGKAGIVEAHPGLHGDVVLTRKDAPASYNLAVTVDDAEQGITDIVRGQDLVASTDIHRLLQHLLDLPVPRYHHHRLITDSTGKRLSKRDDARALATLREVGWNGAEVAQALRADPPHIARFDRSDREE